MSFSNMRHRITIQKSIETKDSYGQALLSWIDIATVWASIEPLSGKEYFATKKINEEISVKITIRYLGGITPDMRIVLRDRIFDIVSVINHEERNRYLILMCKR